MNQDILDLARISKLPPSEMTCAINTLQRRIGSARFCSAASAVLNTSQPETTDWYDTRVQPVRAGVYEVLHDPSHVQVFSYYCTATRSWYVVSSTPAGAYQTYLQGRVRANMIDWKWRGLIKNRDTTPITDKQRLDWIEYDQGRTQLIVDPSSTLRATIDAAMQQ